MLEYPKIPGPFKRHVDGPDRNKLIVGEWSSPELEALSGAEWCFTEKVDGTNIRVHWDGHKVEFGGRTDAAQIPAKLVQELLRLFPEELFEQTFGADEVTLYGEGYGAGIQKGGGNYLPAQGFVLFDVRVGKWWLRFPDVVEIAAKMGIRTVPLVLYGTIDDGIYMVKERGLSSAWGDFPAEGLVGVPTAGFLDRGGNRIMVKIKAVDFRGEVG